MSRVGTRSRHEKTGQVRQHCAMATYFFSSLTRLQHSLTHPPFFSAPPIQPPSRRTVIQRRQTGLADPQDSEKAFCAAREGKRAATRPIHIKGQSAIQPPSTAWRGQVIDEAASFIHHEGCLLKYSADLFLSSVSHLTLPSGQLTPFLLFSLFPPRQSPHSQRSGG